MSRNQRLDAKLRRDGALRDPQWIKAFAAVPRHVFLPRYFVQSGARWRAVAEEDPGWLDRIYGDAVLVTHTAGGEFAVLG